jgi:hypothetical protein
MVAVTPRVRARRPKVIGRPPPGEPIVTSPAAPRLYGELLGSVGAVRCSSPRTAARKSRTAARIARRLLVLLGFGLLHVLLLWDGDILVVYAVVGAILVAFRNASARTLLRWAAGLLAVPLVLYLLLCLTWPWCGSVPPVPPS